MRTRHIVLAFVAVVVVNGLVRASEAAVVCPEGATVQGVDVSWWQGTVDWSQVAASGVTFAYARISNGLSADSSFAANYAGIKAAGLMRGAYQTLRPGEDVLAQAELSLASIGTIGPGDLPLALDVSVADDLDAATIAQAVREWVDAIQYATGRMPVIYTNAAFWNDAVASQIVAEAPLWVANWYAACPDLPSAWRSWKMWQHSATGSVPGIAGTVNMSVFNGPLADLQAFAGLAPVGVPAAAGPQVRLYPCRPNPFNPRTTITFDLPEAGSVRLAVFDVAGRQVCMLVDQSMSQGSHEAVWNGRDDTGRQLASGTYLYRLEAGEYSETKRMTLVR